MKRLTLATGLLISGCATDGGSPPAVQIRTVEVVKEVPRPCPVKAPPRPPAMSRPLPSDAIALAAALALQLSLYTAPGGWADKMTSALDKCLSPK